MSQEGQWTPVSKIGKVSFEHVRRELNQHADRLSNAGMDANAWRPS